MLAVLCCDNHNVRQLRRSKQGLGAVEQVILRKVQVFIGGIQLLSLGVVGEYIGKIYAETKQRPRFIIEQVLNNTED